MTPLHHHLRALLSSHHSADASEALSLERTSRFIEQTPAPSARSTLEGHITASAVVMDSNGRALLLHHAQLGLWVQPGGHLEPGEFPQQGALREALEETGLPDLQLSPDLLDIDVHRIPHHPRKGEPEHWHYDLCFLARTQQPEAMQIDPMESRSSRWVTSEVLAVLPLDPATVRRLNKAFTLG